MEGNLPFMPCFTLYLRAISDYKPPERLIFWGGDSTDGRTVFCVTSLGGLYLKGLIHEGAYFRNFTVLLIHVLELSTGPIMAGNSFG